MGVCGPTGAMAVGVGVLVGGAERSYCKKQGGGPLC